MMLCKCTMCCWEVWQDYDKTSGTFLMINMPETEQDKKMQQKAVLSFAKV